MKNNTDTMLLKEKREVYEKRIEKTFGLERNSMQIFKKAFGMLKNVVGNGVLWQRAMRREW